MSPFRSVDDERGNGPRLPLRRQKLPYPLARRTIEGRPELKVGLAIYQAIGRVATALEHAVLDGVRLKGHEDDRDLTADEKANRSHVRLDLDHKRFVTSHQVVGPDLSSREVLLGLKEVLDSVVDHLSDGIGHDSSPSVGAPEGAGCGDSEPTGGDPTPAGGFPQPSAGTPSPAFGKTPGAGKGGALVPPAGATSAVQLGEASPAASPSLHIKKQYLVEPCHRVEGMFNVDCARCGDGQTFGSHTMAEYIRTHTCT